jgi:hypothetical protein
MSMCTVTVFDKEWFDCGVNPKVTYYIRSRAANAVYRDPLHIKNILAGPAQKTCNRSRLTQEKC